MLLASGYDKIECYYTTSKFYIYPKIYKNTNMNKLSLFSLFFFYNDENLE